jgi:hypothetical protein
MKISIAQDFSVYPGGRLRADGDFSGEAFREDWLLPNFGQEPLEVDLDGTRGFDSSFLEEAFGGLVRVLQLTDVEALRSQLIVTSSIGAYVDEVWEHIQDAVNALNPQADDASEA